MKSIRFIVLCIVCVLITQQTSAQKSDIRVVKLTLTGQDSPLGGNMVDLDKGRVYPLNEAGYNPKGIDFGFMFGSSTGGNLISPVNQGILTFGNKYKDAILLWGNDRNNSTFINLGNGLEAQKIFDEILKNEDIENLYNHWYNKISDYPEYDPNKQGPVQRLRQFSLGDVILFRSENKSTHHIFRITKYVQGRTGTLELEVKSPKKTNKKK